MIAHGHPAFRPLAGDIGFAGLALGMQRVELLLQTLLGRFARVDGAAQLAQDRLGHVVGLCARAVIRLPLFALRLLRPKKTHPFQRVPVMARAMAERDL